MLLLLRLKEKKWSGLQQRYVDDAEFPNTLRMIVALAFVPPDEAEVCFEQYCDYAWNDQIIDYFEDTYIGRFRWNAPRRAPLFAQALCDMFHKTINEIAKTNNSIEGWQRSFQATVGASHPSFWKFIEKLIQEQRLHRVSLLQVFGGQPAPPAWRQYFDANQRLIRIVDNFPNLDAMQYLRSIAYNNPLLLIHSFLINNYLIRKRGLDCQN